MNLNPGNLKLSGLFLVLFLMMSSGAIGARKGREGPKGAVLSQSYVWYDGDRSRTVWLDPALVVEFGTADIEHSTLKKDIPSAQLHSTMGRTIRIWNIGPGLDPKATTQRLRTQNPPEKYSPVFHEGPNGLSRKRGLPGNVIVYLKPEWSKSQVQEWVDINQLQVLKKLNFGPNIYLIKTPEGLESLTIANQLHQSGQVVAAMPEWWEEIQVK